MLTKEKVRAKLSKEMDYVIQELEKNGLDSIYNPNQFTSGAMITITFDCDCVAQVTYSKDVIPR